MNAAPPPAPPFWRSRKLWHALGYAVSAAWMVYVLIETKGDARAPLFNYIFVGPLALWGGGLLVAAILKRFGRPAQAPPSSNAPPRIER